MERNSSNGYASRWLSLGLLAVAFTFLDPAWALGMPGERDGPHPDEYDPNWRIRGLLDFLTNVEEELLLTPGGGCGHLEVGFPTELQTTPDLRADSPLFLVQEGAVVSTGSGEVTAHQADGTVDLVMVLSDGPVVSRQWTLTQTLDLEGDIIYVWGTLVVLDVWSGTTTLTGGWTYSQTDGVQEDPASDPGFHNEVAGMFACADGGATAGAISTAGLSPGDTLRFLLNLATMAINYVLDMFIPYEPATSCDGPAISNGAGQSCEDVDIPCEDKFEDMCENIDELPGVGDPFKQCMQGRCGCGGSNHKRLKIECADSDDCGPCGGYEGVYYGCNIAGSTIWYCDPTEKECECLGTVFHEMSHACGVLDQTGDSERIGDWFKDECNPVELDEQ